MRSGRSELYYPTRKGGILLLRALHSMLVITNHTPPQGTLETEEVSSVNKSDTEDQTELWGPFMTCLVPLF